jgi:hypothetical protein
MCKFDKARGEVDRVRFEKLRRGSTQNLSSSLQTSTKDDITSSHALL